MHSKLPKPDIYRSYRQLMEDSGSVATIAGFMTEKLGTRRAVLAVVLAGALVTYGGVSLFVAFFVIAPMAEALFRAADIPRRLMPAAIMLGASTFTMSALPGTPSIQNAIPMPFFGTTAFAAPGLGMIASAIMLAFGLWWLARAQARARANGEGFGDEARSTQTDAAAQDPIVRQRTTTASAFDPNEIGNSRECADGPSAPLAFLPLIVVIGVNVAISIVVLLTDARALCSGDSDEAEQRGLPLGHRRIMDFAKWSNHALRGSRQGRLLGQLSHRNAVRLAKRRRAT